MSRALAQKFLNRILFSLCLVFASSWAIAACSSQPAATYHVSPSGNDANPGSQSQPWKTIQKAADTLTPGDTVLIHAGVYYEQVMPAHSGEESQYITYQSFGDGEVVIDAQAGQRPGCIEVKKQGYLRFIGLTLRNAGYEDLNAAFSALPGSHHLVLDQITAETSRFGILLRGGKTSGEEPEQTVRFVSITNSTIRNNAAYGIFLYFKVTDSTIGPGNRIYNENDKNGLPEDDQYGINLDTNYPGDPAHGPRRITITGNEVYGNRIQGIRPWNSQEVLIQNNYTHHNGATGIQVEDGCQNVIVDGNRSEYNAQTHEYETGIWIDSSVNAVVQNNVIRGNQIGLIVTSTNRALLRRNVIYENNRAPSGSNVMGVVLNAGSAALTFVHNSAWRNGADESRGNLAFCIKPPVTDTVIKNNIFSESLGEFDGWFRCPVTSDYNNFYNARPLKVQWIENVFTWPALLENGQERHSLNSDPRFANPAQGDFSLTAQSPNVDSGSPLTQTLAAGSGTSVVVADARYFSDGMGMVAGDAIRIGEETVTVQAVDYAANLLTVSRAIRWNEGDSVSYAYAGALPDRGAWEAGLPQGE